MVVPTCPTTRRSLTTIDIIVKANTRPAEVTTEPGSAHRPNYARVDAGVDLFLEP